jgi:DNA-binding GntR family transcriptional regulator
MTTDNLIDSTNEEKIRIVTLADAVVERIRNSILEGRLKPGEKLDQKQLAGTFGTSRMPVRDALKQLQHEGFVQGKSPRGLYVADMDLEEFQYIYEVRQLVEGYAGRLAVSNYSDASLERVTLLFEKTEHAEARGDDIPALLKLDSEFHLAMYEPCKNPHLIKIIQDLMNATWSYRIKIVRMRGETEYMRKVHGALFKAFKARDGVQFERLIQEHLKDTVKAINDSQRGNSKTE